MTLYECHCVIVTLFAKSIALRGWLEGLVLLGLRGVLRAIALLLHFWRILLRYYYTFWEGLGQGKFYRKDGFAWKPCGLHRTLWSRRPWDFHAIAPKGWLTPAPENGERSVQARRDKPSTATERAGPEGQTFHGHETPLRGDGWRFREGDKARNGGRRSRSAAKPLSDRWSPKRFAPTLASLRFKKRVWRGA